MPRLAPARILVIKHGAFGDFILAAGAMQAIRKAHANAHITLLTTAPYAGLGQAMGLFDRVMLDQKPKIWQPLAAWQLWRDLRQGQFDWVYDLQTSQRSSRYLHFMRWRGADGVPYPAWSGIAAGCSHPHSNPKRDFMHTLERQAEQLAMAGISQIALPDLGWMVAKATVDCSDFPARAVLLVPGGAPHRTEKRWPVSHYRKLADRLLARGLTPVWLGGPAELALLGPDPLPGLSLVGKTSFYDLARLATAAQGVVGNDTGPMHVLSLGGCPALVLYGSGSDPALCGQRGPRVAYLKCDDLQHLSVDEVEQQLILR